MNLNLAAREFNAGNFRKAEQLCLQQLVAEPSDPEAMNLMAALAGQARRHDLAAEWARKAIEIRPRDPYYHRNHITALLSMDRVDYAAQAVEAALRLLPGHPEMLTLRGVVRARQDDLEGAVKSLEAALEIEPNLALAHYNLSEVLRRQGHTEKSLAHLKKSLELDPNNPDAVNNMAGAMLDAGEFIEALRYLQRYLQLAPRSAQAYCNLSVAMSAAGDVRQSLICLRNALKIDPSLKDPRFKLINLLTSTGEFDEAEKMLDEWEATEPGDARLLSVRTRMQERRGLLDEARATFERIKPEDRLLSPVRVTEAMLLDVEGKPAEAAAILEDVMGSSDSDAMDTVGMRFSLGKFYDSTGEYEKAFENYHDANQKRRKGFGTPFDAEKSVLNRDFVIKSLSDAWQARTENSGYDSSVPIFIIGMPRSGTSLTEQILGAHSQVYAAGELQIFSQLVRKTHDPEGKNEPQDGRFEIIENSVDGAQSPVVPANFEPATVEALGKGYVEKVLALADGLQRVSDKMPYNYLFAPLIQMALPGAKIIHTRRHPIDTCVSCYFQNFTGGSEYAFDLEHLAVYYKNYQIVMQAWRELGLQMLEINYEDLVTNTESTVRGMLEYCNLEFEPDCLASHKNKRAVVTASYQQVRQPIYQDSVERWKHYEPWIAPLLELNSAN